MHSRFLCRLLHLEKRRLLGARGRPRALAAVWSLAASLAPISPVAAADYQVIDLGTLDGTSCVGFPRPLPVPGKSSFATALSDRGQVVGGSCATVVDSHVLPHTVTHAFVWSGGAMTDIGTLGLGSDRQPDQSAAYGVNDAGQLVGRNFLGPAGPAEGTAFLRSGPTMTSLDSVLGGFSSGLDINNSGKVVGLRGTLPDVSSWSAFLYDTGSGQVTSLPGLGGIFRSEATAINDAGDIAGYATTAGSAFHAVRWTNQIATDLGTLGGTHSFGYGINESGDVVGRSYIPGDIDEHAFLHRGGVMQDLGTLGGGFSYAYGINKSGLVVGSAATASAPAHAFLYGAGVMRDLNDSIPPGSGWILEVATAMSSSGEIVGFGRIGGEQHAFLLTPSQSFFALAPCRVLDTRNLIGPLGGPALVGNSERSFTVVGPCGLPVGARAISANVTVTGPTAAGDLRFYPGGTALPLVSAVNYAPGQTRANSAVVRLGVAGDFTVRCDQASGTVDLILDVNGYFR